MGDHESQHRREEALARVSASPEVDLDNLSSEDLESMHAAQFRDMFREECEAREMYFIDGLESDDWGSFNHHDRYKILAGVFGGKAEPIYAVCQEWGFDPAPLDLMLKSLIDEDTYTFFLDKEHIAQFKEAQEIYRRYPDSFPKDILERFTDPEAVRYAIENNELPYKRTFKVSAYYSPEEGQSLYSTGTYEGDIRLNGEGVLGYWEDPVFAGMIAAPRTYERGTQVIMDGVLDNVETFTVADRGGAIVPAGERGYKNDRLDVWFGRGEEALKQALTWGKQDVDAIVIPKSHDTGDAFAAAE